MERVLDDVSFAAGDHSGQDITIDGAYVESGSAIWRAMSI